MRLPQEIFEKVDPTAPQFHQPPSSRGRPRKQPAKKLSRKEQRKAERQAKKQQKSAFFHRDTIKTSVDAPSKIAATKIVAKTTEKTKKSTSNNSKGTKRKQQPEDTMENKLNRFAERNPHLYQMLKEDNLIPTASSKSANFVSNNDRDLAKEDAAIKLYAKKLKVKHADRVGDVFKKDGLDFLLDIVNNKPANETNEDAKEEETDVSMNDQHSEMDSDLEEDSNVSASEDDDEDQESGDDFEDEDSFTTENEDDDDDSSSQNEKSDQEDVIEAEDTADATKEALAETKEDSSTSRYVPPHLRNENGIEGRLKRTLQGHLNRLNTPTFINCLTAMAPLFASHSRQMMSSILTDLILDAISNQGSLLHSWIANYAALVVGLGFSVESGFGGGSGDMVWAHFVQHAVEAWDKAYKALKKEKEQDEESAPSKICSNMTVLICHLYSFKVIASGLVYDLLKDICEALDEIDVEMLLKIIRLTGSRLRADDPVALKDLILKIQEKTKKRQTSGVQITARFKFMLEQLSDLKNNKTLGGMTSNSKSKTKVADRDSTLGNEVVEVLRKTLRNFVNQNNIPQKEPLRCSLDDIRSVHVRGKWWLIGATWTGRVDQPKNDSLLSESASLQDNTLLQLAKKLNINTEVRRNIFAVLMSSEDYADAFEKLMKLNLKDKQEREIVRMVLFCCTREKVFNPYYAHLAERLCRLSHNHRMTFQFALWDFFKELTTRKVQLRNISHYARLYAHLCQTQALSLAILKVVDFATLQRDRRTCLFLQMILCILILQPGNVDDTLKEDFENGLDVGTKSMEPCFERLGMNSTEGIDNIRNGIVIVLIHWIWRKLVLSLSEGEDDHVDDAEQVWSVVEMAIGPDQAEKHSRERLLKFIKKRFKVAKHAMLDAKAKSIFE